MLKLIISRRSGVQIDRNIHKPLRIKRFSRTQGSVRILCLGYWHSLWKSANSIIKSEKAKARSTLKKNIKKTITHEKTII
mgnify:FL=1